MSELQPTFLCNERAFDRRTFLGGALLVLGGAALGRVPVAGADPSTKLEAFLELSQVATGVEKLPHGLAHEYLEALDAAPQLTLKPSKFLQLAGYANGHGPTNLHALERSAAFKTKAGKQCVEAIAAAWWSGMVPASGDEQRVVTFSDALVWREVHEPTTCQGATGSWAQPGRAVL
jgi:D-sorbitol dehydrogenase-like protein